MKTMVDNSLRYCYDIIRTLENEKNRRQTMNQFRDKNGKLINVSYFGDLKEKLEFAEGYCNAYNGMVEKKNSEEGWLKYPMLNSEDVVKRIKKQHAKFYGEDSKYTGKGNLREVN